MQIRWRALLLLACIPAAGAQTINTIAGTAWVFPNHPIPAAQAPLGLVSAVAAGPVGTSYIGDPSNNLVFKVDSSATLTVVAGNGTASYSGDNGPAAAASINAPAGLALDLAGNLYIADSLNNRIRMVTPAGDILTVAGNGAPGFSGDGGPALSARLNFPTGVAVDAAGDLFIADTFNARVREVTGGMINGVINTVAGSQGAGYSGDGGAATSAQLSGPRGVAVDPTGQLLYIADTANNVIREVVAGTINTVAGNGVYGFGGDGGAAAQASLEGPQKVVLDANGDLFICDTFNRRIREVTPDGAINTVAGNGGGGLSGNGGPAVNATLYNPADVAVDASGDLYIADTFNQRVREVAASIISITAGDGAFMYGGDGGPAIDAFLDEAAGVAVDGAGDILIVDALNQRIRRVSGGYITTVAGSGGIGYNGDNKPAVSSALNRPSGVAADAAGDLFIADTANQRVRKVNTAGIITTLAGTGVPGYAGDQGAAASAQLNGPRGVAVDAFGNVFIADTLNHCIREVHTNGTITSVAGIGTQGFSGDGGPAASAALNTPNAVAVDGAGNLYIADSANNRLRKVTAGGIISTIAGNGLSGSNGDGGWATRAQLSFPYGVTVAPSGIVFIADTYAHRIREVTPDGVIVTVAGDGTGGFSGDAGPAYDAMLDFPQGVAVDRSGDLLIADTSNDRVRKVTNLIPLATGPPTVWIDGPAGGSTVAGTVDIYGWAIDNFYGIGTPLKGVQIAIDGHMAGQAGYGVSRTDVCGVLVERPGCPNVGYTYAWDTTQVSPGHHTLTVSATDNDPSPQTASVTIPVTVTAQGPPTAWVDFPVGGANLTGTVTVSGWAVDNFYSVGTAISQVVVKVDNTVMGPATYGVSRADVCGNLPGRPGCPNVGYTFELNTAVLPPGPHTLTVSATASDPASLTGSFSVPVIINPTTTPVVNMDAPQPGLTFLAGDVIPVYGWAVDNNIGSPTAISPASLAVKVDGHLVGTAVYGTPRPDVCGIVNRPGCPNVGFSFPLNTSGLAPGPHTLTVSATDTDSPAPDTGFAGVAFSIVSSTTPPYVDIDTPKQGTIVPAGAAVTVAGWAVDNYFVVGTAISQVQVKVDGIPAGNAAYGVPRADVCAILEDRPLCPNVGYTFSLSTSGLAAGPHTITVSATDSEATPQTGSMSLGITIQ